MGKLNWDNEQRKLTEIINKDILDFINYAIFVKDQITQEDHVNILGTVKESLVSNVAMFYMNLYQNMQGSEISSEAEALITQEITSFQEEVSSTLQNLLDYKDELEKGNVEVVYEINQALIEGVNNGREKA